MNRRQWITAGAAAAAGLAIRPALSFAPRSMNPIRLHSNENPYGPSAAAREAVIAAISEANRYPNAAYSSLARLIAQRENLTPDHIVVGAGSQEVLRMTAMAYGLAGGEVLVAHPTYEGIERHAATISAYVHRVPLDDNLLTDLAAMDRRTTQSVGLVFVCNPNNPTGTICPGETLGSFCEEVSHRSVILVDEAYYELVDDPSYKSMAGLVATGHNVIVSRTFSKVYGLAGLRVGYALARPDIARRLRRYRSSSSLNILGVRAATAAYQDQQFVAESRARIQASRSMATVRIREMGFRCPASHANFIFFHLGSDISAFQEKMEEQGILVGRPFPPYLDWCRLSIGTDQEMRIFLDAFANSM